MIYLLLFLQMSFAGGSRRPVPAPDPEPNPVVSKCVMPEQKLVTLGSGAADIFKPGGEDHQYAWEAMCWLNRAYATGCLEKKVLAHDFKSLHGVVAPALKKTQKAEAYQRFVAGAPYALDIRWYSKRFTSTIGYTYNWKSDTGGPHVSETRIWTNWRNIGGPKDYAHHLAHELSHQARAGGFVHYTFHQGSFPYEIGDIAWECMK